MRRTILTLAAIAAAVTLGAGTASAFEVQTSNSADSGSAERPASSGGTASIQMPGTVVMPPTTHVWEVVRYEPRLDDNGDPVLDANGKPVLDPVRAWVPIDYAGVPSAVIVHP